MSTEQSLNETASLPPLALIAGPTASGKSDLALRLAMALRERGREPVIVNADSAQVYADLAVLSARPLQHQTQRLYYGLLKLEQGELKTLFAPYTIFERINLLK